jgi:lipoate---protein ligase
MAEWSSLADVEPFRRLRHRHAVIRQVDHPTVVLGSTQRESVLDPAAVVAGAMEVVRRRGGGGAVMLRPGDHLWVDAWIPRDDPLWQADVARAATWVGEWWQAGLGGIGLDGIAVHEGKATPGPYGALVCFSGRGPGEVFAADAKVTGVSQWRSREGALFHTCAYTRWDPAPLVDLLALEGAVREVWRAALMDSAIGIEDLLPAGGGLARLADGLLHAFPTWGRPATS